MAEIQQMSVKDKIAMWNSMAVNSAPPPPQNHKISASNNLSKPKQQDGDKKPPAGNASLPQEDHLVSPLLGVATNFKKTESTEYHSAFVQPAKPADPQKKEGVKTVEPKVEKSEKKEEVETEELPKFSDIKKQLEIQTAGKGIYFAAVANMQKVKIVTSPQTPPECEFETDMPKCSVKEQAAKLAQFYEQKHLRDLQKNQEKAKKEEEELQNSQEASPDPTLPNQNPNNCLNITAADPASVEEAAGEAKPEAGPSGVDLTLRAQKNKRKKQQFDSDED